MKQPKRRHGRDRSPSPPSSKKHHHIHGKSPQRQIHDLGKHRPAFISYLESPNLPPKIKLMCEIVASTPPLSVAKVLDDNGIRVTQEDVEQVLKLSYGCPAAAVKFFRWAGYQLNDRHSPYAWNLVVDLLGKNSLFDAMWDAIKSMKEEGILSLATFASVFSSYVLGNRVDETFMTFEVMDQYGVPRDIVALNSLLSVICREGKTEKADEFLRIAKDKIRLDADSFAILLEGWENEGNVAGAKRTFGEMVEEIGWDPRNVPAYDSFLCTLIKAPSGFHEALKFLNTMKERRCSPGMKFFGVALEDCVRKSDARGASLLWEAMTVRSDFRPDTQMYNMMISLHSHLANFDIARRYLDEMVYDGVFPDSKSYNTLFQYLVKSRKLDELSSVFTEMVKNEFLPTQANCIAAVRLFLDSGDPYMAIKVWKFMVENYQSELEETGNFLVLGLRDCNRVQEAVKYAEDMIERKIKLSSFTLSKLKQNLVKAGKGPVYDELFRKWKLR
ncbi:pentatricopeptide repeat-containing protein At1g77360, mitochondrial-like [Chenopodium quinoa]|uniref:pentatricopeptide repeat-containing protein At1g77360, mitochondrial-like n=1 Tax=Chenopodium quinoa TaxID=63459 RepID=UPI000B786ADF|nr:pentatricopeptide repeat-containing protein At1g77360, mitochondrial-like [Chenopodium quinoa]